jgi:heme exporter protein C
MKFVKFGAVTLVTLVIVAGIAIPTSAQPTSWFQFPVIPGLEEKARNIFFHVPTAWTAVVAFLLSLYYGARYLRKREIDDDILSVSSASLGLMFCILATITGSVWAKFNWGSFWNWDPRETSIFVLLLIYGAYFALRSSLEVEETRARLSAVYAIVAGLTAPFFIFVMPRIMSGLHPGAKGDQSGSTPVAQLHMPPNMRTVFFLSLIGFTLLFVWLLNVKVRLARIEYQQSILHS